VAVNHLVGGSNPSRGARKIKGLAFMPTPIFLLGEYIGEYRYRFCPESIRQIFPTAAFKSSGEIVV